MPRKPSDAGTLLTPEGHEDREEHSGWVVEEVAGPGRGARRAHLPVAACLVTQRTHGDIVSLVTHLHAGRERATASAGPGRTGAPLAHVARMPRRSHGGVGDSAGPELGVGEGLLVLPSWTLGRHANQPPVPCPSPPSRACFRQATRAVCHTRSRTRGPALGFMLGCPNLRILNDFLIRVPCFHSARGHHFWVLWTPAQTCCVTGKGQFWGCP